MSAEDLLQLIEKSNDTDHLQWLREEVENDRKMDEDDRRTVNTAIDARCSLLNAKALQSSKQQQQP